MKLVPLGDKIVLKQLEAEETTKSGNCFKTVRSRRDYKIRYRSSGSG